MGLKEVKLQHLFPLSLTFDDEALLEDTELDLRDPSILQLVKCAQVPQQPELLRYSFLFLYFFEMFVQSSWETLKVQRRKYKGKKSAYAEQ